MTEDINANIAKFTDRMGTEWDLTLTFAGARRIDETDFSNLGVEDGFSILEPRRDVFNRLLTDSRLLVACVFAIIRPQLKDKLGIDPAEDYEGAELAFLDRLDGESIKACRDGFWGSVASFFPEQKTVLFTLKTAYDRAQQRIGTELKMMEADLTDLMDEEVKLQMNKVRQDLKDLKTKTVVGHPSSK